MAWYSGTAGAIYKNINFIKHYRASDVLVLSGDHAYRMDYRPLIEQHRRSGADVTIALKPMHGTDLSVFGTAKLDRENRIIEYREKAPDPCSNLVSMTIYAFRTEVLLDAVTANAANGKSKQIYDEVLPLLVPRGRVFGWVFRDPWEYLRPASEWYEAHMKMLVPGRDPVPTARVLTNPDTQGLCDVPAAWVAPSGRVTESMVAPGCRIAGTVSGSVLSPRVVVEPGAFVIDSVILDRCRISRGARVKKAVLDKDCVVGPGVRIGDGRDLVVLGKSTRAGTNVPEGPGVPIRPWVGSGIYTAVNLDMDPSGKSDMGWSG
jgi:glucose-1-phosphate adenylyltransferase